MSLNSEFPWQWVVSASLLGIGAVLLKWYTRGRIWINDDRLRGKIIIITGANSGIGKASALELAKKGATIILACRDMVAAKKAFCDIRKETGNGVLLIRELDLASLHSVRKFASRILTELERIDVLINNAGLFQCPYSKTSDGFEMQIGVNHLGHFLLTNLLLDRIKISNGRIVIVSSGLHKYGYIDFENINSENHYDKAKAYCNSKLANNLFARKLAEKVEGTGVCVYCLRPGIVRTNLGRHKSLPWYLKLLYPLACLVTKSPYEGCQTVVYCSVSKDLEGVNGGYYANCEKALWSAVCLQDEVAEQLWDVSAQLTGLS